MLSVTYNRALTDDGGVEGGGGGGGGGGVHDSYKPCYTDFVMLVLYNLKQLTPVASVSYYLKCICYVIKQWCLTICFSTKHQS